MNKRIRLLILKVINFSFFEISFVDRFRLFRNHISNQFFENVRNIEIDSINLKTAFVISLPFRIDRRERIGELASKNNLDYQFYDGEFLSNNHNLSSFFSQRSCKHLTHGSLGCGISHVKLLRKITKLDFGLYLIFEDDVILNPSFEKSLKQLLISFPKDCDIFYLGSRNNRLRDILFFTKYNYCRAFNPRLGAFAYAITSDGAQKLLSHLTPIDIICGGIDTALGILARRKKIIAYQFYPTQVFHDNNSESNIYNPFFASKPLHWKTKSELSNSKA